MKNFPAAFTTEKNRTDGAHPIWILRLTVAGVSYWLCDNAIVIPAFAGSTPWPAATVITTLPWVKAWGTIQQGFGGALGEFHVADFSLDTLIDQAAVINMETLATSASLTQSPVELYEWFHGCSDPPQRIFLGRIRDLENLTDTSVSLSIQDESILLEKNYIGNKSWPATNPDAEPGDVGKILPIVYNSAQRLPAIGINTGPRTTLTLDVGATALALSVADSARISAGDTVRIDTEDITVGGVNGTLIYNITRGANSTTAVAHKKGSIVWRKPPDYKYIAADHPVDAITRVLGVYTGGVEIDLKDCCTTYSGRSGNEHPSYPGKAVVTVPEGYINQPPPWWVNDTIIVNDTIGVDTGSHAHTETAPLAVTQTQTGNVVASNGQTVGASFAAYLPGGAVFVRSNWSCQVLVGSGGAGGNVNGVAVTVGVGQTQTLSGISYSDGAIWLHANSPQTLTMSNAARTVDYTLAVQSNASAATGVAKTGAATKTGAAAQAGGTIVLTGILVDCSRAISITGIVNDILVRAGESPTAVLIGALPDYYKLSGVIQEYRTALYWLNLLAFQVRCWFAMSNGLAKLIVRPAGDSLKTIPACIISDDGRRQLTRKKTDAADLITTITVLYGRDWSQSKSDTAYQQSHLVPGATGTDERPELFQFDFVINPAMAAEVGAFYLAQCGVRRWVAEFYTTLRDSELEFGDPITLGFLANTDTTIIRAEHAPGSSEKADTIKLTALY